MTRSFNRFLFLSALVFTMGLNAQEHIILSDDEITRFGIEFSSVDILDGESGMQVPATVINSPLMVSDVMARVGGVLQGWQVLPGETVSAGQVLGVINSQEILGIQQEWIMAESNYREAEFNLGKDEMLHEEGVISEQRLVRTRRDYQQARINAHAAQQKLELAGFDADQLEALRKNGEGLGIYYIRAPLAGTVSHLAFNAGAYVTANAELVSFASGNLWVRAQLPARVGRQLESGQQVRIARSGQKLTIRQQDYMAEAASQMIDVYAEFNQPTALLPGQVVDLVITPEGGGLLVPSEAVVHSGDETQVFVRVADGVEVRTLSLIPVGAAYLAQSGLSAGDQLVTRGAAQLKGIQLGLGGE